MCEDNGKREEGGGRRGRFSPAAALSNWRRDDLSFAEKLRLGSRNSLLKLRNRSRCCGHPGEPGC